MMQFRRHVLINGLSAGSGGGYTVACEVLRHLALARTDWLITLCLIEGYPLHAEISGEQLPANAHVHWAPHSALRNAARGRFENHRLVNWAAAENVDAVIQLNGMKVPRLKLPTLCHFQDPWPYRPEAWQGPRDRIVAWLKRRAHVYALANADACGWTSHYLETLICSALNRKPKRSHVFYNGLPASWNQRIAAGISSWSDRPPEIITISNVAPYKRQELVIRALPELLRIPGLESLRYRILGSCDPAYRTHLLALAARLGLTDHVTVEGRVPRTLVDEAYARARCMVLMSVSESFGIPAVEAMSFGTPVVVADCCALPEICGPAAERVAVDDQQGLTAALRRVLTDAAHAEHLRQAGIARIAKFQWADTAGHMAACLEDIFQKPAVDSQPPSHADSMNVPAL